MRQKSRADRWAPSLRTPSGALRTTNSAAAESAVLERYLESGDLSEREMARLEADFSLEAVQTVAVQAVALFSELDSVRDGYVSLEEFAAALGRLGAKSAGDGSRSLAAFMFSAVDLDDSGHISLTEFVEWMLTMTCGNQMQKLRFGLKAARSSGPSSRRCSTRSSACSPA